MTDQALAAKPAEKAIGIPIILTGALVLIVVSLVIPLPAGMLDFGIAISIAMATLVLVMASLVERPVDFQAFPVLLLVSLVIRLSLNVSSTRLILTEGHTGTDAAGQVINGFAHFVAGGSVLVGMTVFGVITIVNFMVITKGSGRMAEVSARFALDSLPGKQLAIDSDLSSGAISHDEAKQRRIQEQREISFFGSLDGASKFVKGDALAGLVITMVNLVVGLIVGILVHGMGLADAARSYSFLTIGDGLVSQIPALITSMAAALLLSRGGATDTTSQLVSGQFLKSWQAPAIVSAAMAVLSLVPGMPRSIFMLISLAMALASWAVARRSRAHIMSAAKETVVEPVERPSRIGDILDTDDISVEIGTDLVAIALDPARGLGTRINNLRIHIARSFGVILPEVRITDTDDLAGSDYQIKVHGVTRGRGALRAHDVMALGPDVLLEQIGGIAVMEPVYATPARWLPQASQHEAAVIGATVVTPMEVLSTHLMEVVKANLPALLTQSAMQRQIEELKTLSDPVRGERYRKYFDSMVPDKVSPEMLLGVLRALLEERISIRNLPLIVDAISEFRSIEPVEMVYELVRKRLRGQITQQHAGESGQINVIQLHPSWEAEFIRSDAETGRAGAGAMTPDLSRRLAASTRSAMARVDQMTSPVIAAPDHRRRMIRSVLGSNGIGLPIIGLEEIDPSADLRLIGTIEPA